MKCSKIYSELLKIMPLQYAMEWDNPGLIVGSPNKEVKTIYLALDVTGKALEEAIAHHADLVISHHPMIFNSINKITDDDIVGRRVIRLIHEDISLICMHTNYDVAPGCMADITAAKLNLIGKPLMSTATIGKKDIGIGKVGNLNRPMTINKLAGIIKTKFDIPHVTVFSNDESITVKRIAISPGSGKGMMEYALENKADVLITGDIGHHDGIDAMEYGLSIIDAGHYGLEHIFVDDMETKLKKICRGVKIYKQDINYPMIWM